jgi:hypothetical protein
MERLTTDAIGNPLRFRAAGERKTWDNKMCEKFKEKTEAAGMVTGYRPWRLSSGTKNKNHS